MDATVDEEQLLRSCEILFGTELRISPEFLGYFELSGLKHAYRRRALETHPDRIARSDAPQRTGSDESFIKIQTAYENLLSFLKGRSNQQYSTKWSADHNQQAAPPPQPPRSASSHAYANKENGNASIDTFYNGPMPNRPLLFGHFLYYAGLTNWRTIAQILTYQRLERPRVGELGLRFGMLRTQDITSILRNKVPFQRFGQTAQLLGLLDEEQLQLLILHQQHLQKKFGTILIEKKLIGPHELQELLCEFERHNVHFYKF